MAVSDFKPDPKLIASILESLRGVEGYFSAESFAMAMFRSTVKNGKVQVQKNMLRPFKDGEAVFAVVITQRPSVEKPPKKLPVEKPKEG